ncbi:Glycosyltransferase involved in cell wall bisynthesis [Flavobacterium micromati]|uniref:Glycosyltransferase involved in cell wall bisynthesis n=1 Tax=Flavobacterium micromati TaxID=229205 RepID=A0A1M5K727_9FLAO|nr:glycosyltransferase [Flavobacterium micromati]SHG48618.1 Glycosyltransferase involved in cell wall bisynthesis [Flavobacterium micromati]
MTPLVSVAIVTYNQKEYLRECIESILNQDYPNKEIIVADDGSTDGTHEMLLDYEQKHAGLFILKLAVKNLGITKNHNVAHFSCSGKYIAWIGGDDLMLPGKISKQVQFMESNPNCTLLYHNLDVFYSEGFQDSYLLNSSSSAKEGDIKTMIKYGSFNGGSSTMLRRSQSPVIGFDERLPIASDWMYWVDALGNGGEIKYLDEVLGRYRRHSNNVTSQTNYNAYIDHLNSCNILLAKFPHLHKEILYRYSENLRALRYKEDSNYCNWLKASIMVNLNFKSLIAYVLYYISFKTIRK